MTDITGNPLPPLVDDLTAPVVFVSGAAGFFLLENNITITFETARSDHSTNPRY